MAQNMEKDSINFQIKPLMTAISKMISFKVKEPSLYQMENIKELSTKEKWMAVAYLLGKMDQDMKVITKTIKSMVKASTCLLMERNMKVIGKMESVKAKESLLLR